MGVDETISQAEYGIRRMRDNATPFEFYLRGTLVCLKGVPDYLLEEYNSKYSVGIGETEDLNAPAFTNRVKGDRNPQAKLFIDSYIEAKNRLLKDPKCAKLLRHGGSRDISIHRKELPKNVKATFFVSSSARVEVVVRDANGNITGSSGSPPFPIVPRPPEIQYFLSDWAEDDIPTLCEYTLNKLKDLVKEIRAKYP